MEDFKDPFHSNMRPIRGGTFLMGDEYLYPNTSPVHSVNVSDFHLCAFPVTQAQWRAVMGSDPKELTFKGCDYCPVEGVSWDDVQKFLEKLNLLTGFQYGKYRLPTEAEWEYAACGGILAKGKKFAGSDNLGEVAWYNGNSGGKTHPVGGKRANELGLHDMSGNVYEWCQDTWHEDYQGAPADGSAWISGGDKGILVVRGGSWYSGTGFCRSAYRCGLDAGSRYDVIGFRLAQ